MEIISFVNMKGGVGKTTIALNVADCLARKYQKKVAVIDVDPQFNMTQCLFTGEEYVEIIKNGGDTVLDVFDSQIKTMASVVTGVSTSQPKELANINLVAKDLLHVLPGNIELYRLEMVAGEGREFSLKRFIDKAVRPKGFDYVIIDTPPTPSIWMTSALIASNYYVIPVKPDPLSMIGIDLLRSIIERRKTTYDLDLDCLGVVFTVVDRPDSIIYSTARNNLKENSFWKGRAFDTYLPKRTELAKHQLTQPYILKMDDYDLRNNLQALVEQILERIDEL
ncbi:AAA family ATPase [Xanthomonas campestris pv. mirabilis]|uniref:ParA family protein n=1 Tax=Xanthomonas TaxID=338 RepID=UPI000CEE1E09|nr:MULTISPECIES: AAA family ATPase [Xanthomonas]MBV6853984.1 AAA family ATPase [Xanthomonas campestris pv. mirabilis]PPT27450.1 chromosome partitioning protein [Xanthomonas arboricola]